MCSLFQEGEIEEIKNIGDIYKVRFGFDMVEPEIDWLMEKVLFTLIKYKC